MYTYTHIHIYIFLNIEEHLPYRLQLFFTTAMIFSTVFYMSNDFLTDFLEEFFAVV